MSTKITYTSRSMNSKSLFEIVNEFMDSSETDLGINWHVSSQRNAFVEMFEAHLEELALDDKIEQWKIICDNRNNTINQMENGTYHLDVYYKQKNCLNTTSIHYTIASDPIELKFTFSF